MLNRRVLAFALCIVIGLLSAWAVTASAQYYTYPPTTTPPSTSPTPTPTGTNTPVPTATSSGTNLVLYEGPLTTGASSSTLFGFGNTATDITSPGPTLNLKEGTTYTMTVYNVDPSMAHSWEIVSTKAVSSSPLFGAGIHITDYIPAGSSASVTFTPNQSGSFYYVCTRPGHIGYGMYGTVNVQSAVPEFPTPLALLFTMIIAAALSAALANKRRSTKIAI